MNIFSIPGISIALSLVITWALFAIFCSLVHEAIAQVKAERGRFMKSYLLRQFSDKTNLINWANELYKQGPISLLSRERGKPSNDIKPEVFAKAIISAVAGSQLVQTNLKYLSELQTLNYSQDRALTEEAMDAQSTVNQINQYTQPVMRQFKAAVLLLQPSEQRQLFSDALQFAEVQSGPDSTWREAEVYKQLIVYLENWFGELTERLTLWYKKKTRQRLFFVGFALALLLNVDSVQLFTVLNHNPETRKGLIEFYQKNQEYLQGLAAHIDSVNSVRLTAPRSARNRNEVTEEPRYRTDSIRVLGRQYQEAIDSLVKQTELPIGIKYSVFNKANDSSSSGFLLKLAGLLISAFAASFGAPFWFDLLKKASTIK